MGSAVNAQHAAAEGAQHLPWPEPETLVLAGRALRPGADTAPVRFADPVWPLESAHPDAHIRGATIRWSRFPSELVAEFKAFAFAALHHPYPVTEVTRMPIDQPAVTTIVNWTTYLRALASWMSDRGVARLRDLTGAHLDTYLDHVLSLKLAPQRTALLLSVVGTVWAYRAHLPADCQIAEIPWHGQPADELAGNRHRDLVNKTPRISPATMEALLAWSLRMIDVIGPDIVAAWTHYRQLEDGTHQSLEPLAGIPSRQRIEQFLAQANATGTLLPGHYRSGTLRVNYAHLSRILGLRAGVPQQRTWHPRWKALIEQSGVPVSPGSYVGSIRGQVSGQPWRDTPVTVAELPALLHHLNAAVFIVTAYLSGARPGELLNLRRGCTGTDEATGELLISGRPGKGRDRQATDADRTWVVVTPVHDALALQESVIGGGLIFPAGLTKAARRKGEHGTLARTAGCMNDDIDGFIAWVNATFTAPGPDGPIPPDPDGHIHARRLRRTLAYFIVRKPRGLIAAALQYGHLSTKITMGYSGQADTGWLDDLAVERLEFAVEQTGEDLDMLASGEHVSGPAADRYRQRTMGGAAFAGRVITGTRNAARLLASQDPQIHHGEGMTCVWRRETAGCRTARLAEGLPENTEPDDSRCVSACTNLAYTDRNIAELRERLLTLEAGSADPMAPRPIRDRAAAQATQVRDVIDRHDQTRPMDTEVPAPRRGDR